MRILVDLTHPAHVHFFRHAIEEWTSHGHSVMITSRRKDITRELLQSYDLSHTDLGAARRGLLGLSLELVSRSARLWQVAGSFRPDVMTAIGGVFVAQVGWLRRIPSVVFYDTENATLSNILTYPFCTVVATPRCYEGWVPRRKHESYAGYHELAYTAPSRFSPDPEVLDHFDLTEGEPFIVMRLVGWGAAHDVTDHGFTKLQTAVDALERYGRVLISSERPLPPTLEGHRLRSSPELVHHLLYYARLFIGESATMASESATLGTPAIFVSTSVRGYTNEQERLYRLTYTFSDPTRCQEQGIAKALEILSDPGTEKLWQERRRRMLEDMVDVTDYVVQLVERVAERKRLGRRAASRTAVVRR